MKAFIISGGEADDRFVRDLLAETPDAFIIAADRGLNCLHRIGVVPNQILGDYDSTSVELVDAYFKKGVPVERYKAEKNFTDTEAAIHFALEKGFRELVILGACGGRLDHFLSVVQGLLIPLQAGAYAMVADPFNRIILLNHSLTLQRAEVFGKYVSLLPLSEEVTDVTLTGFKYPLDHYLLKKGSSIGVSNEIVSSEARISFSAGIVILIMSKDKENMQL